MRKSKKQPDDDAKVCHQVTLGGVALVLGVSRSTLYSRKTKGTLNLDGIPREVLRTGTWYDLEAVFKRFAPGVDDTTRGLLIFEFIRENGRHVRLRSGKN